MVVHVLHGFDRGRSPAAARPAQEERGPHRRIEHAHIDEALGIPDASVVERFHFRLDAVLLGELAILFQFAAIVNPVQFDGGIVGVGLKTFIVRIEADGHHVGLLLHGLHPLREAPVGNAVLDDRRATAGDRIFQALPAWQVEIGQLGSIGRIFSSRV